jgi:hypothetical protein
MFWPTDSGDTSSLIPAPAQSLQYEAAPTPSQNLDATLAWSNRLYSKRFAHAPHRGKYINPRLPSNSVGLPPHYGLLPTSSHSRSVWNKSPINMAASVDIPLGYKLFSRVVHNNAMKNDPPQIYNWRAIALACSAGFGAMLFGMDSSVSVSKFA